ncbi:MULTISPECIES: ABC transporter permease [unclassified Streptomyces]|uniref:ABC transporter permease n=1 Tax=unclassified Streptomyces TaxID=2593676 RepID=UPI002253E2D4|nr:MULTISPECIES: ABC transporter permease [unclassified Streptomyces]MCX4406275.1 ABC transporter permease [Streptomyces sp. NBC_01764]MCX5189201.1 ABC transporter permease [Streptomyces sp. NBC_00268]
MQHVSGLGPPSRPLVAAGLVRWATSLPPLIPFLARRVLRGLAVLFVLSVVAFGLVRLLPGNPAEVLAGPYSDAATRARLAEDLGLNHPVTEQYLLWLGRLLHGDFGLSVYNGLPVIELIKERLPNTLELALAATVVSVLWGVPAGAFAALRQGRLFDRLARGSAFLGLATPVFVFGLCLVLLASFVAPRWPAVGFVTISDDPVRNLQSVVLPALALGLPLGSTLCRFMRTSMIEVYEQDYMRTALATGATRWESTLRHGLRNASGPVVTVAGLQLAGLVGNSLLIENVFAIPGIGQLTVNSLLQKDYAVTQTCILLLGLTYIVMNLVVDLLHRMIDPKVGDAR